MLTSLALILLVGTLFGYAFSRLRLPGILGMLITGILLGPFALNRIDGTILSISAEVRQLALIIILARAGFSLNLDDLKKVGRPAVLMCFVPACFEIAGMVLLAPVILNISVLEAAIMGTVVAAVSPAVIVPRMLKLMDGGYGTAKGIPQLIMTGASVDDVFVIVLFTSFTALANGGELSLLRLFLIPFSILLGVIAGALAGLLLSVIFKKIHVRDSSKMVVLIGFSCLLVAAENLLAQTLPFSGLLAVMSVGITMLKFCPALAERMSAKLSKLWVPAEILLFVLVGTTVDVSYTVSAGGKAVLLLGLALIFRMAGVLLCMLRTRTNWRERAFCMVAYIPKATVQAAIGGIPLAMGLPCGNTVLTVAVLSILVTAPIGAFGVDLLYTRCLSMENNERVTHS